MGGAAIAGIAVKAEIYALRAAAGDRGQCRQIAGDHVAAAFGQNIKHRPRPRRALDHFLVQPTDAAFAYERSSEAYS